ncbi:GAF domain-containing protein [Halopseudomonas nanhaiensis]|uniref:GAF domain-containing sensor histidine kinase n=1 Tax=Halopseudomonas nanhaiensis TaxID=2830842 RepID=UPI001CBD5635|nr:ATP-binding protein [Halopseudomonas nanhaiensis]UAW98447.1 GAF domain-containing protein [Halopseudomonas nanhaiensis]
MSDVKPVDTADETVRLETLAQYRILDTPPERSFDDLTALTRDALNVPAALISLVARDRQWFKSRVGIDGSETTRDISFCAHAIGRGELMEVPDARLDPRFADNPQVTGDPYIRFYAGVPLRAFNGAKLGTLCVVDYQPRQLSAHERATLERLAGLAEELLSLRLAGLAARERQQALEQQRSMTERLLGSVVEAVVACDAEGQLTLFNQAARDWHGTDIARLDSLQWADYYQLFEADCVTPLRHERIPLIRALRGEMIREEEICIQAVGQAPRTVSCNGGPVTDAAGQPAGAVVVMHDLSERKRIETMKRNFLAAISHELRTPLTSIGGVINLMLGGATGALPESATGMLSIAQSNARRLNQLINDLLDIEKLESGHMRVLAEAQPLLPLLQQAIEANLGYASNYSVTLKLDAEPANPQVAIDSGRLLQVMDNFLSNAAKFSHPGGTVRVLSELKGDWVRVSVIDQGIGIVEAEHSALFQKFHQVDGASDRQRGGTGLGLAIARQLVERMEGRVGVDSRPGEGSRFWFELPIVNHPADASPGMA